MKKHLITLITIVFSFVIICGCFEATTNDNKDKITDNEDSKQDVSDENINSDVNKNSDEKNKKTYDDSDGDGYYDFEDDFPYDPTDWVDNDNDGYGDNSDMFPYDRTEWIDSDGDGYGDNGDAFPNNSSEWKDTDNDGYGDNSDMFPYDRTEWKDTDNDGYGDNSDIYPDDHDNDGFNDSIDIDDYGDAAIKISMEDFKVVDDLDLITTNVEVFFEIYIDERLEARVDNKGDSWSALVGSIYQIDETIIYNIDDDKRYTDIRIVMWDDDFIPGTHDVIDIDGHDDTKGLSIIYDVVSETWTGDDNDGYANGEDDGIDSFWDDDDDGILWFDIETTNIQYYKTFQWYFNFHSFSLNVDIPTEKYAYYNSLNVDRSPYPYSNGAHFVTSTDGIINKIANDLKNLSSEQGYGYYEEVNFVLRFVQTLEYTWDNATAQQNDFWRYPIETLVDEGGDCEDTSILFAAIMESMGYDAVLLLPTGHMAVGIWGDNYQGTYYKYNGRDYYFCETTGEGFEMGNLPSSYRGESVTIVQVN